PVRGAKFRKSRLRKLKRDFCFIILFNTFTCKSLSGAHSVFPSASGESGGQIRGQVGSMTE
ncbi:hypothetical protein, partial [Pectobacterium polaris]|uniref:hypothetical protein n=1 Tax=Pectobacterium polaris TaxID=2042057 RepID=UPI001CA58942